MSESLMDKIENLDNLDDPFELDQQNLVEYAPVNQDQTAIDPFSRMMAEDLQTLIEYAANCIPEKFLQECCIQEPWLQIPVDTLRAAFRYWAWGYADFDLSPETLDELLLTKLCLENADRSVGAPVVCLGIGLNPGFRRAYFGYAATEEYPIEGLVFNGDESWSGEYVEGRHICLPLNVTQTEYFSCNEQQESV